MKKGKLYFLLMDYTINSDYTYFHKDICKIFNLNETGTFIIKKLMDDVEIEDIIKAMLDEYQVDRKTLEEDLNEFIKELKKRGFYE